ncbi:MAG: RagB/SusD family nutrient uptake outer membrane protein [Tannerellaceae bacterium]
MKLKYIFGSLLLSTVLMSSCNDFLSHEPVGEPSLEVFWRTEDDARKAADGLYFWTAKEGVTGRGVMWYMNASDDMVTGRPQAGGANIKNFILDNSRDVKDTWPTMYQLIKRCNDIIANVPGMNISDKVRNEVVGQAYFFRAWAYMWLAPHYGDNAANGGIPIVTEDVTVDNMDVPRPKTVSENYKFAINDFEKAAEMLPYFSELAVEQYGRPHKTAAWAYAAKASLYNAQYETSSLNDVIEFCDKVIPHHQLMAEFDDVFKVDNNWSSEYIWSWTSTEVDGSKLPGVMLENKGWGLYNGWGYFMPTIELFKEFEPGDKRRKTTILMPGDEFMFLGDKRQYYSTTSESGMQFNKYMDPFKPADAVGKLVNPDGNNMTTRLSIPLIRFSEVLLWKAEALIWQGKNGDEPLNQVRTRAGLAPISNATKEDLKHERRCELAGELTNRHFDLVRWGDAQAAYAKPLHGLKTEIKMVNDKIEITKVDTIQIWESRTFNPNIHHVFPIPLDEVNSSKNLKQNMGY